MEICLIIHDYRYGGGPAVNHLYVCHTCQVEAEKIEKRRKTELEMFIRVIFFPSFLVKKGLIS